MVITDHINFMGANPLRGPAIKGRPRFVDLTRTYDAGLSGRLREAGRCCQLKLQTGVYLAVPAVPFRTDNWPGITGPPKAAPAQR